MESEPPEEIFLRFDFPDGSGEGPLLFRKPIRVLEAYHPHQVLEVLNAVQDASDRGLYAAGYLAYEAAPAFEPALQVRPDTSLPLAWFGLFTAPSPAEPDVPASHSAPHPAPYALSAWQPTLARDDYERAVLSIREAIARGETYQANFTFRLRARLDGDDHALYHQLRQSQPVGYAAYLNLGRYRILSLSPELFFDRRGVEITTRPMKGTAPRRRWTEEDRRQAEELAGSEKNRAENLMIADLLRNDLGRLAIVGSVQASHLFHLERYATVWQLTSTITARLPARTSLTEIFTALFPCGSVTGAPKVQTMKLLAQLEETPRGVYCGAIGVVAPGDRALFNVAIRTMQVDRLTGMAEYGIGGGITWDSTPQGEFAEALTKAAVVTSPWPDFELFETLLLDQGRYTLLDRHLARLQDSAAYFGFPFDSHLTWKELQELSAELASSAWRVRLLLARDGELHLESRPLEPLPDPPLPVALAATPVDSRDRFLYHKTTHRAIYEVHNPAHDGLFDVLLWNERGEITEFTRGNLVVESEGAFLTPPRESGLLAGTLRAELLASGKIEEHRITHDDLLRANALWFINSVRNWVRVCLRC